MKARRGAASGLRAFRTFHVFRTFRIFRSIRVCRDIREKSHNWINTIEKWEQTQNIAK